MKIITIAMLFMLTGCATRSEGGPSMADRVGASMALGMKAYSDGILKSQESDKKDLDCTTDFIGDFAYTNCH